MRLQHFGFFLIVLAALLGGVIRSPAHADPVPPVDCSSLAAAKNELVSLAKANGPTSILDINGDSIGELVEFSARSGSCYISVSAAIEQGAVEIVAINVPESLLKVSLTETGHKSVNLRQADRYGFRNAFDFDAAGGNKILKISVLHSARQHRTIELFIEFLVYRMDGESSLSPGAAIALHYTGSAQSGLQSQGDTARFSVLVQSQVSIDFKLQARQASCDSTLPGIEMQNEALLPFVILGSPSDDDSNEDLLNVEDLASDAAGVSIADRLGIVRYSKDKNSGNVSILLYPGSYTFGIDPSSCAVTYYVSLTSVPATVDPALETVQEMLVGSHIAHKLQAIAIVSSQPGAGRVLKEFPYETWAENPQPVATVLVLRSHGFCDEDMSQLDGVLGNAVNIVATMEGLSVSDVGVGIDAGRGSLATMMDGGQLADKMLSPCAGEGDTTVPENIALAIEGAPPASVTLSVSPAVFKSMSFYDLFTNFLTKTYPGIVISNLQPQNIVTSGHVHFRLMCLKGQVSGGDRRWEMIDLNASLLEQNFGANAVQHILDVGTVGSYTPGLGSCPMEQRQYSFSLENDYQDESNKFAQKLADKFDAYLEKAAALRR